MARITVTRVDHERFRAETRGHTVMMDQPRRDTVEVGPTPLELSIMALGGCVAYHAAEYLRERNLSDAGLEVECYWRMSEDADLIDQVELQVRPPQPVAPEHHAGLLGVADECVLHGMLRQPPRVDVQVESRPSVPLDRGTVRRTAVRGTR